MATRHQDWLWQARRDVEHARASLDGQFYEWACFAAQQGAEKALKALFQKDVRTINEHIQNVFEEGELARKINNSIFALKSCIEEAQKEGKETGHLLIYKQNLPPKHTYYRFDDVLIIVPYNLSRGRTKLPVIAFRRRQGGVSEFLEQDFERLLEQHAKPVYDSHKTEK